MTAVTAPTNGIAPTVTRTMPTAAGISVTTAPDTEPAGGAAGAAAGIARAAAMRFLGATARIDQQQLLTRHSKLLDGRFPAADQSVKTQGRSE
jgi:hypothetical protein